MTAQRQNGDEPLHSLNALPREAALEEFLLVCSSRRWAESMADSRPFRDAADLQRTADSVWLGLSLDDWLEAMSGHPRIGERGGASEEHSRQEQAGMKEATSSVRDAIAASSLRRASTLSMAHGSEPSPPALDMATASALPWTPASGAWMIGSSTPPSAGWSGRRRGGVTVRPRNGPASACNE